MSPPNPSATANNNNNNDFLAKAQAATQRMVAASASVSQNATPQQTRVVQELAQDRPTIHAAVTSFLSLVAAKSLTTTTSTTGDHVQEYYYGRDSDSMVTWSNAEALQCSRILLKAINSTTLSAMTPKTPKTSAKSNAQHKKQAEEEYALVAQLWNGLISSEQKPARFLGRRALQHAWSDIAAHPTLLYNNSINEDNNDSGDISQQSPQHAKLAPFLQEFERLLFLAPPLHEDNDAALIWDQDGGQAELQQRRERRQQRATQASKNEDEKHDDSDTSNNLPMIEEITDE